MGFWCRPFPVETFAASPNGLPIAPLFTSKGSLAEASNAALHRPLTLLRPSSSSLEERLETQTAKGVSASAAKKLRYPPPAIPATKRSVVRVSSNNATRGLRGLTGSQDRAS